MIRKLSPQLQGSRPPMSGMHNFGLRRYTQNEILFTKYLGQDSEPTEYMKHPTDYYLPGEKAAALHNHAAWWTNSALDGACSRRGRGLCSRLGAPQPPPTCMRAHQQSHVTPGLVIVCVLVPSPAALPLARSVVCVARPGPPGRRRSICTAPALQGGLPHPRFHAWAQERHRHRHQPGLTLARARFCRCCATLSVFDVFFP